MTITPEDIAAANKAFDVAFAAQGSAEQIEEAMAEVFAAIREQAHAAGRAENYKTFTDGMEAAAQICGSLAETTYDDTDAFEAATGCEAAIMRVVQDQRKEQADAIERGHDGSKGDE